MAAEGTQSRGQSCGNCAKACHPVRKKGRINAKILPNPAKSDRLLGSELNLTIAERDCLQIRTIRAADCTATELKERQKERKRQAQEDRRRKAGAKPREQYERQSASRTREAFGMSERTWRRKGKPKPPNTTEVRHPGILAEVRTQYLSILWSTHFGQNTEKTGWLQGAAQLAAGGARKRAPHESLAASLSSTSLDGGVELLGVGTWKKVQILLQKVLRDVTVCDADLGQWLGRNLGTKRITRMNSIKAFIGCSSLPADLNERGR
jgi:hypothetical protein